MIGNNVYNLTINTQALTTSYMLLGIINQGSGVNVISKTIIFITLIGNTGSGAT